MQSQKTQTETVLEPQLRSHRWINGYDHAHAVPSTKRIRIGLLGQFGVGNFGNDGSLEAMIDTLRRICPEAE
ncbi:hypothetical protein, partial [Mesorhizobium sp. P5_C1]